MKITEKIKHIKIDLKLLSKIRLSYLTNYELKRLDFLFELANQIDFDSRHNQPVNVESLVSRFEVIHDKPFKKSVIYKMMNELTQPGITYLDFIQNKQALNQNRTFKTELASSILNFVVTTKQDIKCFDIKNNMTQREIALIMKDIKFTYKWIYKLLKQEYFCSYSYLCKLLFENEIMSDFSRKHKTKKQNIREKQLAKLSVRIDNNILVNKEINDKKCAKLISKETIKNSKFIDEMTKKGKNEVKLTKKQLVKFGSIVELDGCYHRWFGNEPSTLLLAVDRATGLILSYDLDLQETTIGYTRLLQKAFLNYGVPQSIRTDKRTTFWKVDKDGDSNTPLAKCLNKFDCKLESSSNPRFKPTVERTNGILQQKITAEVRHKKIQTKDHFIKLLESTIQEYNQNILLNKNTKDNVFKIVTKNDILNNFNITFTRKITNGLTLRINDKHYELLNDLGQNRLTKKGRLVTVYESYFNQGVFWVKHGSTKCFLTELKTEYDENKYFDLIETEKELNLISKLKRSNERLQLENRELKNYIKNSSNAGTFDE